MSVLAANAQLTLTKAANEPIIGDVYMMREYDTSGVFPKSTGINQSWNFSNMIATSNTGTTNFVSVASSPSPGLFSNASIASVRRGNEWEFMKSNASTYDYAGMIWGSGDVIVFSNLGTSYSWPISYGSSNTDNFTATQTSGTNTINWIGTISYNASGSGTVRMPGGGTYNNCLLLVSNISVTMAATSYTTILKLTNHEFWASGIKFPLVKSEYQSTTTGTMVTSQTSFQLNTAALPAGIKVNEAQSVNVKAYPNPSASELNILVSNSKEDYNVSLIDLTGKTIVQKINAGKIDVSNIEKGIYILSVKGKNINARKTVIISH
ncbi:MAG: T9SS type A sorting domain-containing protein [Sphingobacteriaceae bacterium]